MSIEALIFAAGLLFVPRMTGGILNAAAYSVMFAALIGVIVNAA